MLPEKFTADFINKTKKRRLSGFEIPIVFFFAIYRLFKPKGDFANWKPLIYNHYYKQAVKGGIRILKRFRAAGILFLVTGVFLYCPIGAKGQTMGADLPPEELLVGYITAYYTPGEETGAEPIMPSGGADRWPDMVRCVRYEGVEALAELPTEIGVQIWDRGTERAGYGRLELTGAEPLRNEDGSEKCCWRDDFSMIVTFRSYGADTYELNGVRIVHQENAPPLQGREAELLGLIGASPLDYQITEMEWAGASYRDDYGIEYRNAFVKGRRKVMDYQAVYQGRVLFPTLPVGKGDLEAEEESVTEDSLHLLELSHLSETAPLSETDILSETDSLSEADILQESGAMADSQIFPDAGGESEAGVDHIQPEELPVQPVYETEGHLLTQRLFTVARTGFIRVSQGLEHWVYERFAVYIPGNLLIGMGMILLGSLTGGIFYAYRRKQKNFL